MKDRIDHSSLKCINLIGAEARLDANMVREDFKIGSDQITCTEDDHGMDKTIQVAQDMILIIEVVMGIIQEKIKGMGGLTIVTVEREALEVKIMIGIGVGHMTE